MFYFVEERGSWWVAIVLISGGGQLSCFKWQYVGNVELVKIGVVLFFIPRDLSTLGHVPHCSHHQQCVPGFHADIYQEAASTRPGKAHYHLLYVVCCFPCFLIGRSEQVRCEHRGGGLLTIRDGILGTTGRLHIRNDCSSKIRMLQLFDTFLVPLILFSHMVAYRSH